MNKKNEDKTRKEKKRQRILVPMTVYMYMFCFASFANSPSSLLTCMTVFQFVNDYFNQFMKVYRMELFYQQRKHFRKWKVRVIIVIKIVHF